MAQLSIAKHPQKIHYFAEPLHPSNLIFNPIKMVLVQGGTVEMGSPVQEIDRFPDESPQHSVTVSSFFMSEYPITQAHWAIVASSQSVN
jgi:formylglycine-generating enzyme required for sulfatase activity